MNNPSPLLPQGSIVEQKNRNRKRVKVAVFFVLAIHAVGLLALLMQGCRRDQPAADESTNGAPAITQPQLTNTPPVVAATNDVPVPVASNPPPVDTTATPPVPPVGSPQDYKVQKGDNYYVIGKKFGVSVKQITEANPGVDPAKLKIGQTLHIPAPAPTSTTVSPATAPGSTDASGEIYTVKSGDTLTTIAKKYNTTVKAIRSANSLTTDSIKVGQKLKMPAKAAATTPTATPPASPADTVPPAPPK